MTESLLQNLDDQQTHTRTYIRTLPNGGCVQLIEEHSYTFKVRYLEGGKLYEGYISSKYLGRRTIETVPKIEQVPKSEKKKSNRSWEVWIIIMVVLLTFLILYFRNEYFPHVKSPKHYFTKSREKKEADKLGSFLDKHGLTEAFKQLEKERRKSSKSILTSNRETSVKKTSTTQVQYCEKSNLASNVFITKYNSLNIVKKFNIPDYEIKNQVLEINFKWFNFTEIRNLISFKILYSDPHKFFSFYEISPKKDTYTYIHENKKPAYHYYSDCKALRSDFETFEIPKYIKNKGKGETLRFRKWVIELEFAGVVINSSKFLHLMEKEFGLKQELVPVNKVNGGIDDKKNVDLQEIENDLNNLIREAEKFYISTKKNKTILDEYGKVAFLGKKRKPLNKQLPYNHEDVWQVLEEFDNKYKSPIKFLLQEYYRVKYNPKLEFDGKLLEKLNFRLCKVCQSSSSLQYKGLSEQKVPPMKSEMDDLPF